MTLKNERMQKLKMITTDVADYFSRLGGSGRYQGFREWHIPAIVVLVLVGINPQKEDFFNLEESKLINPQIWRDTDKLPEKIYRDLIEFKCDPEHFAWYLKECTMKILNFKDIREMLGWAEFLTINRNIFNDLI